MQAGDTIYVENDRAKIKLIEADILRRGFLFSGRLDIESGQWVITVLARP